MASSPPATAAASAAAPATPGAAAPPHALPARLSATAVVPGLPPLAGAVKATGLAGAGEVAATAAGSATPPAHVTAAASSSAPVGTTRPRHVPRPVPRQISGAPVVDGGRSLKGSVDLEELDGREASATLGSLHLEGPVVTVDDGLDEARDRTTTTAPTAAMVYS